MNYNIPFIIAYNIIVCITITYTIISYIIIAYVRTNRDS